MTIPYPDTLPLTRTLLRVLIRLNLLAGVAILALLVASLVAEGPVMRALGMAPGGGNARLIPGGRMVMVLGIVGVPVAHRVLQGLLEIVETVRAGDPFVVENAVRLQRIAWAVLGLELLHLAVGAVVVWASVGDSRLDVDWNLSFTGWLAVLLLFVLARVFEQGARMRDDLAGTV